MAFTGQVMGGRLVNANYAPGGGAGKPCEEIRRISLVALVQRDIHANKAIGALARRMAMAGFALHAWPVTTTSMNSVMILSTGVGAAR